MAKAQVMSKSTNYAGFWIRFLAYLIDAIILGVVAGLLFGNTCPETGYCSSYEGWRMIIPLGYVYGFWVWKSATPGKMALKLRIIDEKGAPLGPKTAAMRLLGYVVSTITLGIGFLWIAWDKEKQGLHDKVAKTHVVKNA